jgi:hypothetical protein
MKAIGTAFMGWLVQLIYVLTVINLIFLSPSLALASQGFSPKAGVPPKLLTLDMRMPGVSPKQVLERISFAKFLALGLSERMFPLHRPVLMNVSSG